MRLRGSVRCVLRKASQRCGARQGGSNKGLVGINGIYSSSTAHLQVIYLLLARIRPSADAAQRLSCFCVALSCFGKFLCVHVCWIHGVVPGCVINGAGSVRAGPWLLLQRCSELARELFKIASLAAFQMSSAHEMLWASGPRFTSVVSKPGISLSRCRKDLHQSSTLRNPALRLQPSSISHSGMSV